VILTLFFAGIGMTLAGIVFGIQFFRDRKVQQHSAAWRKTRLFLFIFLTLYGLVYVVSFPYQLTMLGFTWESFWQEVFKTFLGR